MDWLEASAGVTIKRAIEKDTLQTRLPVFPPAIKESMPALESPALNPNNLLMHVSRVITSLVIGLLPVGYRHGVI